ncbi:MAG: kinase-like domain-containing protein [Benniella sp.]|nr:MAG: kinase-like domain-containing protein [Benniella sp.]
MYILRTVDTLHHNPFTGDKITKARVFSFDSSSLPGGSTSPQHTNLKSGQTLETEAVHTRQLKDDIDDNNQGKESLQSLPKLVAIKYLNNHKVVRKRAREDSHSDDSHGDSDDDIADSTTDDDDNHLKRARSRLEEWQRRRWPLMAETKVPSGIEFGVSAKREIRALKAVQGHPNVIPFLGFTTLPKSNPFKAPKKQHDGLLADPLPLGADLSQQRKDSNNGSLLGLPLGRSLFQDQETHPESSGDNNTPLISSALGPLLFSAPVSGFDSDGDSNRMDSYDFDSSDDDGEEDDDVHLDPSTMSAQQWDWVFSRQPWVGGIIFPYLPLRLLDLIEIGWTAKRPLMVEMSMRQILEGLAWLHDEAGLIHRDLSPTNIMVTMGRPIKGSGAEGEKEDQGIIQCMISDFGCATFYRSAATKVELEASGEHLPLKTLDSSHGETREEQVQDVSDESRNIGSSLEQKLTFEVGTRAYRAPELLFSSNDYTNAIDIWSAGVIFAEMYLGKSLFTADTDITQICAIVKVLGVITEQNWPEYSSMPDAGKLLFNVRDRTPLSQILLSGSDSNSSTSTAKSGEEEGLGSNNTVEGNSTVAPCMPLTLISRPAFELIESMIVYSGAARPSAKEALEFKNKYLLRTKELEIQCGTVLSHQDQDQDRDQDQEARKFLQECVIHEQEMLVQVREELALLQEARKRASNSDSEGDYQDQYYWTDSDDGDDNGNGNGS